MTLYLHRLNKTFLLFVIIVIQVALATSAADKISAGFLKRKNVTPPGKRIPENSTISAVLPGESAKLACPIPSELFGTKVSWIRKRDFLLLTVGESLYTTDNRFFVSHSRHSHYQGSRHSQVWFLHILNVTKNDEGSYECQTSNHPPLSTLAYLKVQNACSEILGPVERVVADGSELKMVCSWANSTAKPSFVFWYHGDMMVNYDQQNGFHVTTGKKYSSLSVDSVTPRHGGNYTCVPSNAIQSSVLVHVISDSFTGDNGPNEPKRKPQIEENKIAAEKPAEDKTAVRQLGVKSPSSASCHLVFHNVFMLIIAFVNL